jgi:hypothetical protein
MERLTSSAIGSTLERAARAVVPAIALAFTVGFALGVMVHGLNDALANRRAVAILTPAPAPIALLAAPALAPVALESLTCRELRELVGTRSKLSKLQLIAMAQRVA